MRNEFESNDAAIKTGVLNRNWQFRRRYYAMFSIAMD